MKKILALVSASMLSISVCANSEDVNLEIMTKIKQEGTQNSQVMKFVEYLSINIGPRLSGSPAVDEANRWALDTLNSFGLTNGHLDAFDFGRGWESESATVVMTKPRIRQIHAESGTWFPGTNGSVEGDVMVVSIRSAQDFERYKGKLSGKIIIEDRMIRIKEASNRVFSRLTDEEIEKMDQTRLSPPYPILPTHEARKADLIDYKGSRKFKLKKFAFYKSQGALAVIAPSITASSNSLIATADKPFLVGQTPTISKVVVSRESFNRIHRLLKIGERVALKVNVKAKYFDDDHRQYNVIADIKGSDKRREIVMAGAHIDSLPLGDGAADNAAGVAIMMEAMRILKALNVKPRRTIRIALWGGEEQGIIGSRSYVQKHLAKYPVFSGKDVEFLPETERFDTASKPKFLKSHERFSVYFNLDNGAGKIRGIYASQNLAAVNIFNQWLAPFEDLGATKAMMRGAGATDHRSFQNVGLPGYQFMQDPLDYFSRTQHSGLDTIDYIKPEDLKQSAIIVAAFLYNASMREELMPRKDWIAF